MRHKLIAVIRPKPGWFWTVLRQINGISDVYSIEWPDDCDRISVYKVGALLVRTDSRHVERAVIADLRVDTSHHIIHDLMDPCDECCDGWFQEAILIHADCVAIGGGFCGGGRAFGERPSDMVGAEKRGVATMNANRIGEWGREKQ